MAEPNAALARKPRRKLTATELLEQRATITLAEFAQITGLDRSTVHRKEASGDLPKRRMIAGQPQFLVSEVKAWLEGAEVSGPKAEHSIRARKAREVYLASKSGGLA